MFHGASKRKHGSHVLGRNAFLPSRMFTQQPDEIVNGGLVGAELVKNARGGKRVFRRRGPSHTIS